MINSLIVFTLRAAALPCLLACALAPAVAFSGESDNSALSARLVASGFVAHDALDKEGETLGAFGSGLACDGQAPDRYLALVDRGPGDGSIDFRPRFHAWRIERDPDNAARLRATLESTTLLTDASGHPSTGLEPAAASGAPPVMPRLADGRLCLDPEGIVCASGETIYISDEYGPFVYQFKRDGHLLRVLRPTEGYLPRDAAGALDFRNNEALTTGRTPNRGFEGLAISPDGRTLTALLQSAVAQDGGKEGGVTRLLAFDAESGQPTAEYAYAVEDPKAASQRLGLEKGEHLKTKNFSVCELHAVDTTRFLVIERDNRGLDGTETPEPAAAKTVWLIDTAHATNLLALPGQPYTWKPGSEMSGYVPLPQAVESGAVKPVEKRLLIDVVRACKESGNPDLAKGVPEKWEGLALRPTDQPGHYTLLMATDNDFLSPVLHLEGRGAVPFPKAKRALDTWLLLFEVTIPSASH